MMIKPITEYTDKQLIAIGKRAVKTYLEVSEIERKAPDSVKKSDQISLLKYHNQSFGFQLFYTPQPYLKDILLAVISPQKNRIRQIERGRTAKLLYIHSTAARAANENN